MDSNITIMNISEYLQLLHEYIGIGRNEYEFLQYISCLIMREPNEKIKEEVEANEKNEYYAFDGEPQKDYWGKIYRGKGKDFPIKESKKILEKYAHGSLAKVIQKLDETSKSCLLEGLHKKNIRCGLKMLPSLCDELMFEHIKARAEKKKGVDISEFNTGAIIQKDDDIPLLIENNNLCARCHSRLYERIDGKPIYHYRIVHINPNLSIEELDKEYNLVALCRDCAFEYGNSPSEDDMNNLEDDKFKLQTIIEERESNRYYDIIEGIERILRFISTKNINENEDGLNKLNYEPVRVKEKVKNNRRLRERILDDVILYYNAVNYLCKQLEIELENKDHYLGESLCKKIKKHYENLNMANKMTQSEIYNEMSRDLHEKTDEDIESCQILISYFVQHCEVFK